MKNHFWIKRFSLALILLPIVSLITSGALFLSYLNHQTIQKQRSKLEKKANLIGFFLEPVLETKDWNNLSVECKRLGSKPYSPEFLIALPSGQILCSSKNIKRQALEIYRQSFAEVALKVQHHPLYLDLKNSRHISIISSHTLSDGMIILIQVIEKKEPSMADNFPFPNFLGLMLLLSFIGLIVAWAFERKVTAVTSKFADYTMRLLKREKIENMPQFGENFLDLSAKAIKELIKDLDRPKTQENENSG